MKLIDLLVRELPKRGGWPDWADEACSQFVGQIMFYREDGFIVGEFPRIVDECIKQENITREEYETALAASQQPAWNGEGLPPVGCDFEYEAGPRWKTATMKFCGDKFAIVDIESYGESWLLIDGLALRPIRTEADRKRDEAIEFMSSVFRDHVDNKKTNGQESVFHAIYDAFKSGKFE